MKNDLNSSGGPRRIFTSDDWVWPRERTPQAEKSGAELVLFILILLAICAGMGIYKETQASETKKLHAPLSAERIPIRIVR
jgi:hypothetical protein